VIEIARAKGWHTINIVRRRELIPGLTALGADLVLTADSAVAKQVADKEIKLALNAVGGDSARHLAQTLAPHGTMVTYGAMGREPVRLDNGLLIFRDIRCRGFWVSDWYRRAPRVDSATMFAELQALVRAGKFRVPIEQTYPLRQTHAALAHASRDQRTGKILLVIRPGASSPV
jgi:trans-2-enoyl-CoA reductase